MQTAPKTSVRENCTAATPMDARLESWMDDILTSDELAILVEQHGSPLNLLATSPFKRNILALKQSATDLNVEMEVFFARKSNKCISFVDAASEIGCGIDTASLPELDQVLESGFDASKIICTAAVKSKQLIGRCINTGVVIAIDNLDELNAIKGIAAQSDHPPAIALRISGFMHDEEKLFSRFGFDVEQVLEVLKSNSTSGKKPLEIHGIHFHLDGYCGRQRVSAISQSLQLIDQLRVLGHPISFLDIGGGFPMSYLNDQRQWETFWQQHRLALLGQREPLTYRNHGLGLIESDGKIHGQPKSYPFFQLPVQADWLREILTADFEGDTIADALRTRELAIHCEPGRSVLDGCGLTVARVEFTKLHSGGHWLVGLAMNHTQCRTSSDDFLVDPIVCRSNTAVGKPSEGFLVGAYCTESELLCKRRLRFPNGIAAGDLVVFPNTAGYLMHFLESRSHQFPLARNLFVDSNRTGESNSSDGFRLDAIDRLQ